MPDEEGLLNTEEQAKLLQYLQKISPTAPVCEFCQTNTWNIMPHVVSSMPLGPIHKWKNFYPVCMVVCAKCGNTKFFNATLVGITWPKKEEAAKLQEAAKKEEGITHG